MGTDESHIPRTPQRILKLTVHLCQVSCCWWNNHWRRHAAGLGRGRKGAVGHRREGGLPATRPRACVKMWPTLAKRGQSRWDDHEINIIYNWRKTRHLQGSFLSIFCSCFVHIVGCLFIFLTAHRPFRLINDSKTHFKWQKSTLTKSSVNSFQLHFLEMATLLPPSSSFFLTKRLKKSLWRYAQFWRNWCQIKAPWLHFLPVTTENDQSDTVLSFCRSGSHAHSRTYEGRRNLSL